MKKFLVGLLLGTLLTVSLVGCGKDEKKNTTEQPSTEAVSESPTEEENAGGGNTSSDSDYIGMTYKEFVETGASITGYTGFNDNYEFTATNTDKMEKYTFTLSGDVGAKLDAMEFGEDYADYIGDLTIETIDVISMDDSKAKEYIGKTIGDMKADGYDFNGHAISGDNVMLYASLDGATVTVSLGEDASTAYNNNAETYKENDYEVFDNCVVTDVSVMMY
ncbi:MAG: hypothetical protein NC225_07055 [Clostridium sp.]|nr:hypothetical protein [Clostridium sp.]MCM1459249.1 hypothetical protein [Bacteroides sp.]